MDGVLVVDKPRGPTSHDVVAWARRALGTRAVGHAGTLDPMATGVLVLGIGEGTKLTPYLMSDEKVYETTVALGAETDTLDAEGRAIETAAVPPLDVTIVERAVGAFIGTYPQRAPAVSAIKKDGVALHERVRRGEEVEAPERIVRCESIDVLAVREREIDLRVRCGKGFYVRSLGRDLARALGTRGHLAALRRIASGGFDARAAFSGEVLERARREEALRDEVRAAVMPIERALGGLLVLEVGPEGARELRHGRALRVPEPRVHEPIAALDERGRLVAITRWSEGALRVIRGFGPR